MEGGRRGAEKCDVGSEVYVAKGGEEEDVKENGLLSVQNEGRSEIGEGAHKLRLLAAGCTAFCWAGRICLRVPCGWLKVGGSDEDGSFERAVCQSAHGRDVIRTEERNSVGLRIKRRDGSWMFPDVKGPKNTKDR